MAFRKWLVRLLVLTVLCGAGGAYYLYESWTDPAVVRAAVLQELETRFPGASVRLSSARMKLFGGVQLCGLDLERRDEPNAVPFASFPNLVLYPDKVQFSQGKLIIGKMVVKEPKLSLIRRADGTWNLTDILGSSQPNEPFPLIEVQQARLTFIDRTSPAKPIEIQGLDLTIDAAEGPLLHLRAKGTCSLGGTFQIEGTANRETGELVLAGQLPNVKVDADLLHRLADYAPEVKEHAGRLQARASIHADVAYHPESPRPWSYALKAHLREARLAHPDFPFPLEEAEVVAHWRGGPLLFDNLNGKIAGARIQGSAELQSFAARPDLRATLRITGLNLCQELYEKLPAEMQLRRLCQDFRPDGPLSLDCELTRLAGELRISYTARAQGLSVCFHDFPYPVEGVTGLMVQELDSQGNPTLKVDLNGVADGQSVRLTGKVFGDGLKPGVTTKTGLELDLKAGQISLDEKFIAALLPKAQKVIRQLKPAGRFDLFAEIRRAPGSPTPVNRYVFKFRDASLYYERFPYPLEQLQGTLELWPGGWRFFDCKARHKGGSFEGTGESKPGKTPGDPAQITLALGGTGVLMDQELEAALPDAEMKEAWRLFGPTGRVDFVARVLDDDREGTKPELDLKLMARGCTMKPSCFPYALERVVGTFHYANRRVVLDPFQARHGDTVISLGRGEVTLKDGKGYHVDLRQLSASRLRVDEDLMQAIPELVRKVFLRLQPDQPIHIITDLTLDVPGDANARRRYAWDGQVAFARSKLNCGLDLADVTGIVACRGTHDGTKVEASGQIKLDEATICRQPLRNLKSPMIITQDALVLPGISARLHGGEVYGPIRVDFGEQAQYRVDLTASQIDLEQFARQTGRNGQVHGKATARLNLAGRGSDWRSLRGNGRIDIPNGARLYDLPLIIDLLKLLSGRVPDGTAFKEAHAGFDIVGERMNVSSIELLGDAISLHGQGHMKADGTNMDLEMYGLIWGRTLPLWPKVIDQIPPTLSKHLMIIRLQGDLNGRVDPKIEPVPIVTEPLKAFLERMSGHRRPSGKM